MSAAPAPAAIYTLSLHDALPIFAPRVLHRAAGVVALCRRDVAHQLRPRWIGDVQDERAVRLVRAGERSEEHTSELQSHSDLVCRLLLEKKKKMRVYLRS